MFKGSITAMVTPMRDGHIDEEAFRSFVEWQVAEGSHGLVPMGTTGESPTLSHDEHKRVVEICVEVTAGRVPVIAGAGSNATDEAIELARHAKAVGADGALIASPYYNRPSQEGIYQHYRALNEAVELPMLIYNVPSRTGSDVSNETVERLSRLPNIVGIKDATGDLSRASLMRVQCGPEFVMLSGDDPTALGYIAHGGHGCISVTCNVAPEPFVALIEAALRGDFPGALAEQDKLIRLHRALFFDASPSPTKYAMAVLGLCTEDVRLPIVPCAEAVRPQVQDAMHAAGLLN
jgi:4-hydroxy-tetrahydrodipicolinate synthase